MKTQVNTIYSAQCLALASFLGCQPDEVSSEGYDYYDMSVYSACDGEYAIGTDEEADNSVYQYIEQSVWAFTPSFLASMTDLPEAMFEALSDKCEDANEPILQVICQSCGLEDFVDAAVSADGRGHFLSSYDGEEAEEGEFFIYRVN